MKVLIAVPTRGFVHYGTFERLQAIRDENPDLDPIFFRQGKANVALTRNFIVQHFLAGDWEALVMVDDDVVPPPHILEMTEFLEEYGMVGIPCLIKHDEFFDFAVWDRHEAGYKFANLQEGIHQCDAIGTGCVMIHRRVFDVLGKVPFVMSNDPERCAGEDFVFCDDLRSAGFKVGYWWNKWYADHYTAVSLASMKQIINTERS